ncbi:hypothetical protein [Paenibacillus eucommiae]|uniref:DNA-binding ferritin-like protein n=1 Tax=Paenibacillus eucommiae TaxID=1355755 RepID=A0ABS4INL5_9BACL|nr:hypothetical protein [Paenibacillus eucommiae]MBP1988511.1 DNA-binding ferritin-like protein [Paenibacillus eucommiae]
MLICANFLKKLFFMVNYVNKAVTMGNGSYVILFLFMKGGELMHKHGWLLGIAAILLTFSFANECRAEQGILSSVTSILSGSVDSYKPFVETVDSVLEPVTVIGTVVESLVEPVLEPVLQPAAEPVLGVITETVSTIVDRTSELTEEITAQTGQALAPVTEKAADTLKPLTTPVKELLDKVVQPVLESTENIIQKKDEIIDDIEINLDEETDDIADSISNPTVPNVPVLKEEVSEKQMDRAETRKIPPSLDMTVNHTAAINEYDEDLVKNVPNTVPTFYCCKYIFSVNSAELEKLQIVQSKKILNTISAPDDKHKSLLPLTKHTPFKGTPLYSAGINNIQGTLQNQPNGSASGPSLSGGDLGLNAVLNDIQSDIQKERNITWKKELFLKDQYSHAPPFAPPQYLLFLEVERTTI